MTRDYAIAEHIFSLTADNDVFKLMANYEPFFVDAPQAFRHKTFALQILSGIPPAYSEEFRQEEGGQAIVCGKTLDGMPIFLFQWRGVTAGCLICSENYEDGRLITTGSYKKYAIDNALMIMYAMVTADKRTVLFHAAVVSHEGRGYMFIGPSGTGKSTHAGLWRQAIPGAELVNDDNPVVRIDEDGRAKVYGSPWSGKTPCYRNVGYPLGGVVALSQAPRNKIWRLNGINAYAALLTGISGKRWDRRIADGLHETEIELTESVPVWRMECMPDEAAAKICVSSIAG